MRTVPGEGGEAGALLRARDWSATPLGPTDAWPEALKTLVAVMLGSAQPMYLAWGPERVLLYNDAYAPLCGARHPGAFGRPFAAVWPDALPVVGPILDRAFDGRTHHQDDLTLVLTRNGAPEEAHFSFSFTPVRDGTGSVLGVLCVCQETTRIVEGARRDAFRAELGDALRGAERPEDVMQVAAELLGRHLRAGAVGYSEIDGDGVIHVLREWSKAGLPSLIGRHHMDGFGRVSRELEAGRTVVLNDVANDPDLGPEREAILGIGVKAALDAPVMRDGRITGALFVHATEPRAWTGEEVVLVEEVAARTWSAVYRRRAEAGLREREARLRLVQEAGKIGHFDADLVGGRIHRSPEYLAIQGLPADTPLEGVFDDGWRARLHPDDRDRLEAWFAEDMARGGPYERRYRIVRPSDGAVRHLLNRGRIELDDAGRPIRLLSAQTDVTEEVETDAALRDQARRLALALDAARMAEVVFDVVGDTLDHTAVFAELLGLPGDRRLSLEDLRRAYHPEDRERVIAERRAILAGSERFYRIEHRIVRPDQAVRWVEGRGEVIREDTGRALRVVAVYQDVTERREAENAAEDSRRELQTMADALPVLISYMDREVRYRFNNKAYEDWFGLSPEALWGKTVREVVGEAAFARVEPYIARVLTGERLSYEAELPYEGAGLRHVQTEFVPRFGSEGSVEGYYALVQDVSEQKRAQAAVRQSEARLRSVVLASPFPIMLHADDGEVLELSRKWTELTGYRRDEIGTHFDWFRLAYPAEDQAHLRRLIEAEFAAEGEIAAGEMTVRARDGSDRVWDFYNVGLGRLPDGRRLQVSAASDVTERRAAEERLRESERRFRAAVDAVRGILWTNDAAGRMSGEQPGWAALTGQTREEYEGYGWASAVHPDDAEGTLAAWNEAVAERTIFIFEHRLRTASGDWRRYAVRAVPVLADDGSVREWVGVHTDVTEQREGEEALKASAAALRESEEHYRHAAELNPQVAWTATPDGQLDRVAERWREWTGTSGLGDTWGQGLHPDDLGYTTDAWVRSVTTGEPYDVEHRVRMVEGSYRWARSRAFPRRDDAGAIVKWYGATEDIHDRKEAETAVRESEARLRLLADAMPQLVWTANADGVVDYYNARAAEYAGLTRETSGSWRWEAVVHPEDQEETYRRWTNALAGGEPYTAEHRLKRTDGAWAWHVSRAVPARDGEGRIVKWYGTATDVHALKTTDAALRESEARFRNMADHAPVMMWVTDETGWCQYLNQAWYDFTGQTPKEAEGFGWIDAAHPDDEATTRDAFVDANARRAPFRVEYRLRRKDGVYRWCIDAASPRFGPDGEFLGYVGSVIDIDERREAEDRIRESETRLRTLTDALPAFVWFATPDGALHYFNDRWFEYTGQTPEEALPNGWTATLHPDDDERTAREWEAARSAGVTYEIEVRYRRHDGAYRWYVARAEAVRDAEGAITGWFGTSTDIHDRKTAESELQRLNDTLEQRVQERTRELIAAEEALRQAQKMEAIGQLTGGVAHDFNNLLTVIRSSADLLRRRELPEERRRKYVDAISDTADRAAKLTGQLLAFARRQALKPEVFDAGAQVTSIAEMLRTVLGARVELVVDAREGSWVEADLAQFETALVNMAVNARDAMNGEGALSVVVAADAGGDSGGYVSVVVTDTGPGIPEDVLPRIFEPFFTTKDLGKGTGLGLSQVYGFAKQSGGEITVRNMEGGGAAFALHLPRAPADRAPPVVARSTPGEAPSGHGRVLVVEDNAQVGEFATQLLNDLGYLTAHEPDAQAALQRLDRERDAFDLVFSDVVMPGMGGVEFGRRVRDRWPDLPVVLTSGYSHVLAEDARHGFPLLHKPYSVEELSRILRRAVAARA